MADNLIRGYENEEFEAREAAALDAANVKTSATKTPSSAATTTSSTVKRVAEDPHPDLAPESVHTSAKPNSMLPFITNGQLAATAIVLAGSFMTFVSLAYPTRVITRLAQVRTKDAAGAEWRYWVKMETASNQMWAGSWNKARLIDPSRIDVGLIRHGTSTSPPPPLPFPTSPSHRSGIPLPKGQSPSLQIRPRDRRRVHVPTGLYQARQGRPWDPAAGGEGGAGEGGRAGGEAVGGGRY